MPHAISNFSVPLSELVQPKSIDRRTSTDTFRSLCFKAGVFEGKRGSAYVEFGNTKVLSQVHGPREYADGDYHSCSVKVAIKGYTDEKIRAQIQSAMSGCIQLNKYAKSEIEIEVSVITAEQGVLQAALVSSCLALVHSGIELWDVVVAAHVAITESGDFILDPSVMPENCMGSVTVGVMPQRDQMVCTDIRGALTSRLVNEVIRYAANKANSLHSLVKTTLAASLET
ncbi:unnamed protein product [Auanema sp. JU1783]|nr:unnamed protein product [Auanema sp. JU1783]